MIGSRDGGPLPGLNSDDHRRRVLECAIVTLHGMAPLIDDIPLTPFCNISGDQVRDEIERGFNVWISREAGNSADHALYLHIDTDGVASFNRQTNGEVGSAAAKTNNHGNWVAFFRWSVLHQGAIADYYFWWARRLLSYGLGSRCNGTRRIEMAHLAAMVGLNAILEMAALLLHEMQHFRQFTGPGHCQVGSGGSGGRPLNLCHDALQFIWLALARRTLGLGGLGRAPHLWFGDPLRAVYGVPRYAEDGPSRSLFVEAEHCPWMQPNAFLEVAWTIGVQCATPALDAAGLRDSRWRSGPRWRICQTGRAFPR